MFAVPEGLSRATTAREGAAGVAWLATLPPLVDRLLASWGCVIDGDPVHGQVAVIVPVRRAGGAAALKVSFPNAAALGEGPALRRFDGRGAVRLLGADEEACALLLERAGPRRLDDLDDVEDAIEVAGDLARRLAVPADAAAPALADTTGGWEEQLDRQVAAAPGLIPPAVVERARETIRALADDATGTLIHGDLHFGNVLAADREPWLAVDPAAWRGTAAYDAFAVVAGRRGSFRDAQDVAAAFRDRILRFSAAARVDTDLAVACTQARATSSYLHQVLHEGDWFDAEFLRAALSLP
ncbi:hypothetical protein AS850_07735 [Frondihabitans sp. 762G35]|uniref:aminoglycoside phosphotransferase family protein n=1 Tax=Frondihabitans sp. 762G35 TaxID=1446794 RepID=UPI000D21249B|nr:aminoglycoside phosphotransferase family protein [Frondihabitans sp. 762G35]ARC56968.1 hypothetical protein AS850_07735 [Frondihabitans sp. 762G35]